MQRIVLIVFPGFQMMSCAVISAFEFTNRKMGEPVYEVHLRSETGGSVRASAAACRGAPRDFMNSIK